MMKIYLAPLEGITGYAYRQAVHACFGGFDKYFIPFIRAKQNGRLGPREKKDVDPENNKGMYAVPQIMANHAGSFLETAEQLKAYGYHEINLNLGCPSKTVVTKGCGAGFLAYPEKLDRFLDEILAVYDGEISIKTRLGMEDADGFEELLQIYNQYPVKELIVHPRVQRDFYKNKPDLEAFGEALAKSRIPVCYNGDIFSASDYKKLKERFPQTDCVMTGRGVLADPSLARELRGGRKMDKEEFRRFHDMLYHSYCENSCGDKNVLFKMKELWFYLVPSFTNSEKYAKKIKKCERCTLYESIISDLLANEEITGAL